MSPKIRVLILDDEPLVRNSIRWLLATTEDLELVGETANFHLLPDLCRKLGPHILLIGGGKKTLLYEASALARKYASAMRLLALLQPEDILYFPTLLTIPLHGGCLKSEINENLVHILRAVAGGATLFSLTVFNAHLPISSDDSILEARAKLSNQEERVLTLIVHGLDNATIANELKLAEQTVRNYVNNIYNKFAIRNRAELVAKFRAMPLALIE